MAKFFLNGKWKKRTVTALSLALSLTVSMGLFTACGGDADNDDDKDDEETTVTETDTQLLKNGNFEFYSDKDKELDEKRALINTPTSWSFTSGSPSSDTTSGIINTSKEEWDFLTDSKKSLISFDTDKTDKENKTQEKANEAVAYAVEHWDEASAYDRLEFLKKYDDYFTSYKISTLDSNSDEAKLFAKYKYSVDFEDVETLREELGETVKTHYAEGAEDAGDNLLMIHNSRTSDGVLGTAQYYTSSTTITLKAGTAAELSVWVKTSHLKHYYSSENTTVTSNAGAYIGVTHTVGGATLDQMQIKNINTEQVEGLDDTNGWQQYSIYIRANTFATSTFKIVLGLGMGSSSSDRYEQVNGYALFDDLTCNVITNAEYDEKVTGETVKCDLDSLKDDKIFDATKGTSYALDLHAEFAPLSLTKQNVEPALTSQYSGTKLQYSLVSDNREDGTPANKQSIVGLYSYKELKGLAENNGYLVNIFEKDFEQGLFPFANENSNVIMLLSTNGAAYTATVTSNEFTLASKKRMLISFFVKTSEIRSGKMGASATLVDGENETAISAFDSTTVATVDIDDTTTDIYNGWVQCFFFVENNTKDEHTFTLKLNYGPTAVANSSESDYGDGYAAFANFETKELTATQFGYASSGSYTKTVSLTGKVASATKFDDAAATSDIKTELAKPVNFYGVQSGSINITEGGINNPTKEELKTSGLYTGLLNSEYAETYEAGTDEWNELLKNIAKTNSGNDFWGSVFGDKSIKGMVATQPLVIMNTSDNELPAYGYFASTSTATVAASSYQKISMRVKVGGDAKAYIYLIDTSDIKAGFNNTLAPSVPAVTYWYDDEGNICKKDPSSDDFKARNDIAYYLDEENGLYTEAGKTDGKYYANLANYKTDENGNLTTTDGTIAFHFNDDKYYAYYDKTTKTYSLEVNALPTTGDIVRYTAPTAEELKEYGSCIVVEDTADKWTEVSFYVHTGSEAKSYRLEIWAGARDDYSTTTEAGKITVTPGNGKGIPAGGYVFFDNYSAESTSNYETILNEYIAATKDALNKKAGKVPGDEGYLGEEDNLPKGSALYYTFTFYDSPSFLRYDVSKDDVDEDGDPLGNPYGSYKQSTYSEQLVWFSYSDGGEISGSPVTAQFLDYSAYDVDVPQDDLGSSTPETPTTDNTKSDTNIWLILSSAILAVALLFAIVAIIVRRVWKKTRKNASAKAPKQKKEKAPKLKVVEPEPEADEPEDENNPYND